MTHALLLAQNNNPGAMLGGMCCGFIVGLAVMILINAVILRAATAWVAKIHLDFGKAALLSLLVGVLNLVVGFLIGFAIGIVAGATGRPAPGADLPGIAAQLLSLVAGFFIASGVYGTLIKYPDGDQPIGFAKGALITLVSYAIILVIVIVIALIVGAVLLATGTRLF